MCLSWINIKVLSQQYWYAPYKGNIVLIIGIPIPWKIIILKWVLSLLNLCVEYGIAYRTAVTMHILTHICVLYATVKRNLSLGLIFHPHILYFIHIFALLSLPDTFWILCECTDFISLPISYLQKQLFYKSPFFCNLFDYALLTNVVWFACCQCSENEWFPSDQGDCIVERSA